MEFGVDVSSLTGRSALAACGADWPVVLMPAAAVLPDGRAVQVPGNKFVVAGDEPVGQVGSRYHPVQNLELLEFAERVADQVGTVVSRAGVTQGRRRFWCWVPCGAAGAVVSTTHHGRGAVSVQMAVPIDGTLVRLGPEPESTLSFPHGPTLQARLDDPSEVAGWANAWEIRALGEVSRLASTKFQPAALGPALEGVVPVSKARTGRQESNRHAVMDMVAGRWVELAGASTDGWSLLRAVAWYLDRRRRASPADRVDQSVDDSGWVTRAKFVAHGSTRS